jgi:hypothetical protein
MTDICRKADCGQPCAPYSVFCAGHHAEQLARVGARALPTLNDRLNKLWKRRCDGVFTDGEAIQAFFDEVDPASVESTFDELAPEFQSLISDYLTRTPPEALPPVVFIGPNPKEAVEEATTRRRSSARVLQEHLKRR